MQRWPQGIAWCLAILTVIPAASALMVAAPLDPGPGARAEPGAPKDAGPPSKDPGAGALDAANCSLGTGTTELSSGVSVTGNLGDVAGANCEFVFTPDASFQLAVFTLTLTTSDFDLYVRKGSPPTTAAYDCRPFSGGTTAETCPMDITDATPYYAMVHRFSGSGDFTITAKNLNTCSLGNAPTGLGDGVNATGELTLDAGAKCVFTFSSAANTVRVNMTPLSASDNFNLYLRRGAVPGTSSGTFDCASTLTGLGTDTCSLSNLAGDVVYAMAYRPAAGAGAASFNIRAEGLSTCSLGNGPVPLAEDTNVTANLTAHVAANCVFSFAPSVTADMAKGMLFPSSSTQNFDLAMRAGLPPRVGGSAFSARIADCFSNLTGLSTDTCTAPAAATVYAVVHRPAAGTASSSFNVKAQSILGCSLGPGTHALADEAAQSATLANELGAACNFVFAPPAGEDTVRFTMVPPATGANFDLYVRRGAAPTTAVYDCRPLLSGNATEACLLGNDGTTLYAMVRRSSGNGTFSITASASSPCSLGNGDTALAEGVGRTASLTADAGATCYFTFANPSPWDVAAFEVTPATGDYDLYVQVGARPTLTSYACRSIAGGAGAAESCEAPGEGVTFHAMVTRSSGSGDFTVTARSASSCGLGPGVHDLDDGAAVNTTLKGVTGAKCYFAFAASAAADLAHFVLDPDTSDFDLYVRKGSLPTTTAYDCRPFSGGTTTETCSMLVEDAAPWYAMVRRFSGSGNFEVAASNVVLPTLENGVPVVVDVPAGQFVHYKVVVPAGAAHLGVAIAGDPSNPATEPFATGALAACRLGPEACTAYATFRTQFCANVPQPQVCQPLAPATNADLYVRHISDPRPLRGLPTLALYSCRSDGTASVESCTFNTDAAALAGNPGAPASVVPSLGAGKYFVGVRGAEGAGPVVLVAAHAPPALPPV